MGPTAQDICGNCNEKLPKPGDYASCSTCTRGYHFERCSIKKQTWLKQSSWVCSTCRKSKKGSSSHNEEEDSTSTPNANSDWEVSSLGVQKSILEKVTALMDMREKLDSIEKSMAFFAEKYDAVLEEVVELRAANKELNKEVEVLKKNEQKSRLTAERLAAQVTQLTSEVAEMNQYGRRLNLEIHGVRMMGNPKEENIAEVLKNVAMDIKVEFQPTDIHQAHRLQPRNDGNPPTIIVQFHSKTVRDQWLYCGRKARLQNVYFNENLSQHYRLLLKEAKLRARTHGFNFVWFRGGRVLVKKGENVGNVLVIKTFDDLKKIG